MNKVDDTAELRVRQLKLVFAAPDVRITHTILNPGEEIPWHAHSKVSDTFYVVRGPITIMMRNPEDETDVNPGNVYQTAAMRPHRVVNKGEATAEFFLIQGIGSYDFKRL